jgi:predicted dehydrogenase
MIGLRHPHVGSLDPAKPAPGYIHTFKLIPGVEIVAYCEDSDATLLDQAREFDPAANVYASVDELLEKEDFALACVVLPANEIPGVGTKLAEAGKDFYVEKQFARTAADLAGLVDAVRRNGVKALAGYPWRFHPAMQDLKQLIDQGILGAPLSLESRLVTTQVRPGSREPTHFMFTAANEGGGVLHMLGGHYIEFMRHLMQCEVKSVQALTGRPLGYIDDPLEDVAVVAMEYENGALGSLHAAYAQPPLASGYDSSFVYRGEHGWANWTPVGGEQLEVTSVAPTWSGAPQKRIDYRPALMPVYGGHRWFFEIIRRFVEEIETNSPPAVTLEDGLHVLQVIEAAYEAARTGKQVTVQYGVKAALGE